MSEKSTPQLILDKAIDLSVNLTGSGFPISIFPSKIQKGEFIRQYPKQSGATIKTPQ